MPIVVCVRSLVPKEKNSPTSAISPAISAARGSSIIVPTLYSTVSPRSAKTLRGGLVDHGLHQFQFTLCGHQWDHHFRYRRLA